MRNDWLIILLVVVVNTPDWFYNFIFIMGAGRGYLFFLLDARSERERGGISSPI